MDHAFDHRVFIIYLFARIVYLQIDTSKVQMDVIKPWVATRVTELLGFEDEVLINFIYGMLEEKVGAQCESHGHHIQSKLALLHCHGINIYCSGCMDAFYFGTKRFTLLS